MIKRILAIEVKEYIGKEVLLQGWVHRIRQLGQVSFIILRDRSGIVQTVAEEGVVAFPGLSNESIVIIRGKVSADARAPGGVEVRVRDIDILSQALDTPPIEINKKIDLLKTNLDTLLTFRAVCLRNPDILSIFKVQAELIRAFRQFLIQENFTEIHTPKIVATGTEGGAELFSVRYFEQNVYLAQSPQFYKQIMVGSGLERVFEVGHAYRAEDHNTTRHLNEYVSLDLEMGFIENEQDVIELQKKLIQFMFTEVSSNCAAELKLYKVKTPQFKDIPQLTLIEAKEILRSKCNKDLKEAPDLDPEGERLLCQYIKKNTGEGLVYITSYPISKRPFYTMPREDNPEVSRSFDLLYDGEEITTGGQRIHNYGQLIKKMKEAGLNEKDFDFYLQAFKYGMPPHGGLAIGTERITKQLLGLGNIREASLFPRDRTRVAP
ncbi:MAG: Aspartate--tRNA(Asp/Asn) ligase [Syntrophomonadaceae bacterium]|nr:Aspartate--tRNA(Asp/Asn) ligase [Bacillota bacterium]